MSDADAAQPAEGTPAAPATTKTALSIFEAVDLIESIRDVNYETQETERQRFLKAIRVGDFPPPVKPEVLPRPDSGGDVDWTDCFWDRHDIESWAKKQLTREQIWPRWRQKNVKKFLDFPSLASFVARKVRRSDEEWEHWADRYKARAYTGKFLMWAIWVAICGWFFLVYFENIAGPSWEEHEVTVDVTQKNKDGVEQRVAVNVTEPLYILAGLQFNTDGPQKGNPRVIATNEVSVGGDEAHPEITLKDAVKVRLPAELQDRDLYLLQRGVNSTAVVRDGETGELVTQKLTGKDNEYGWDFDADGVIDFHPAVYITADGVMYEPQVRFALTENNELAVDKTNEIRFPIWHIVTTGFVPLIIFAVLVGLPGLSMLFKFLNRLISLSYTLTDKRLIVREGILNRRESQVRTIMIKDLDAHMGPIQSMLNVGNITVFSDDVDDPELLIEGVRNPRAVKDRIYKVSEQEKKLAGWAYIEGGRPVPPQGK